MSCFEFETAQFMFHIVENKIVNLQTKTGKILKPFSGGHYLLPNATYCTLSQIRFIVSTELNEKVLHIVM